MENIPGHIFDLCGKKSFKQLSASERTEVLEHMDEATYNALHEATMASSALAFNDQNITPNTKQKKLLMQRFRQNNKKPAFVNTSIALWKVAASFLLLFTVYYFYARHSFAKVEYITQMDTLYLDKPVPDEKIFDTIYITLSHKNNNSKQSVKTIRVPEIYAPQHEKDNLMDRTNLSHLSISDYNNVRNNKKGNNIKDDSLIESIGFVHL